jgi:hypothetical protein
MLPVALDTGGDERVCVHLVKRDEFVATMLSRGEEVAETLQICALMAGISVERMEISLRSLIGYVMLLKWYTGYFILIIFAIRFLLQPKKMK